MKPALLERRRLPLAELSPAELERFITGMLGFIGPNHGFADVVKTSGPTDDGFDAYAKRIGDRKLVALQYKRFDRSLSAAIVGLEVAKVALQAAIEGSEVAEHRFITSGKVGKKLDAALRAAGRPVIEKHAQAALQEPALQEKRAAALKAGIDPVACITTYARSVEIICWSGEQFEIECRRVWDAGQVLIQQFFSVEKVVQEVPGPDLDEEQYLKRLRGVSSDWIELDQAPEASPPPGIHIMDPQEPTPNLTALAEVSPGCFVLLVGEGGSGKTTTLQMSAEEAASRRQLSKAAPLPVMISLLSYLGDLDALIHSTLGLTRGHWRRVPGRIVLFADGLNEVPEQYRPKLAHDLQQFLGAGHSLVLSVRSGGLHKRFVLRGTGRVVRLRRLTRRQVIDLASKALPYDRAIEFVNLLRERRRSRRFQLAELPFGLRVARDHFRKHAQLPADDSAFMEALLSARVERDRELLGEFQPELLRYLAEEVAYEMRIERPLSALTRVDAQRAVSKACQAARAEGVFGAVDLRETEAFTALQDHELLIAVDDGSLLRFRHELVADYLASRKVAVRWRDAIERMRPQASSDDALVFAAGRISVPERAELIRCVAEMDLGLAADCAVQMGRQWELEVLHLAKEESARPKQLAHARAAYAAGRLQIDEASEWLREKVAGRNWEDAMHEDTVYPYVLSLAHRGEPALLEHLQPGLERVVASPIQLSGGSLKLWEVAPAPARLARARQWLQSRIESEAVVLSIRTIREQGDESDIPVLRSILERTGSVSAFVNAFWALRELGETNEAARLLRARIGELAYADAVIARELTRAGEHIEVGPLLAHLVASQPAEGDESGTHGEKVQTLEALVEALKRAPLDDAATALLMETYERQPEARSELWEVATHQVLAAFEPLAERALASDDPAEVSYACEFARAVTPGAPFRKRFGQSVRQRLERDPQMYRSPWELARVLTFLALEEPAATAPIVADLLRSIYRYDEDTRRGHPATLIWRGNDVLQRLGFGIGHAEIVAQEIVTPAAEVAPLLPVECRLGLLELSLGGLSEEHGEEVRRILRECSPVAIDENLSRIADPWVQVTSLAIVAPLGSSPIRVALLKQYLVSALTHPAIGHQLVPVISMFWSEEVANALVEAILVAPFEPGWIPRDVLGVAMEQTTPELADKVVRSRVGHAKTEQGNQLLARWAEASIEFRY